MVAAWAVWMMFTTAEPAPPIESSAGVHELAGALAARERILDRREAAIADREADLREIEQKLDARLKELNDVRAQIDEAIARLEVKEDERVKSLTAMVEAMKPAEAAAMLTELELDLAVRVMNGMMQSKAGKMLATLPPEESSKLAEGLTKLNPLAAEETP